MPKQILVIAPSWIGDMVMAQPMLGLLKQRQDCRIDVLALSWVAPLLSRMSEVEHVLEMPIGHGSLALGQRYQLGQSLRGKYDQAIVLPNTLKSALIPMFARIPRRTGYLGERRYGLLNDIRVQDGAALPLLVQRYSAQALPKDASLPDKLEHPRLVTSDNGVKQTLDELEINRPTSTVVGLCPGAEYGPAKRWPVAAYAGLANKLLDQGNEVWLFGSNKDKAITQTINQSCQGRCRDLAGETTLEQAINLMSLTDTVVTNDSGLMHIACALGRKVVAIYGSTSPEYTPPLSDQATVVRKPMDCSPCFKRECPLGHMKCLNDITIDDVMDRVIA